jgi:L-gulonate 5-dehydrogenase
VHLAAVTNAPGVIEIETIESPDAGSARALIAVDAVGICGTDLHIYDGTYSIGFPLIQGHEFVGVIEDLPRDYDGELQIGMPVAIEPSMRCGECQACLRGSTACARFVALGVGAPGGLQQFVAVPPAQCHPINDLPADIGVFCEPVSVALRAVTRAAVCSGDKVVVLGCGPIGLAATLAAVDKGAEVLAIDVRPARLEMARILGAAHIATSADEGATTTDGWTSGGGADVVIEATGVPALVEAAVHMASVGGRISMVGVSEQHARLDIRAMTRKELIISGSLSTFQFRDAVDLVARNQAALSQLPVRYWALEDTSSAFEQALNDADETAKTIIRIAR